jgi:anti-sigma B factor antagonist
MALYIVDKLINGIVLLDLRGRLTLGEETAALRGRVKTLVDAGYIRIVLSLADVVYIDSTGIATLVEIYTTTRAHGGDMKLLGLTKRSHDLLRITHLSLVFELYDDLNRALNSFPRLPAA